MIKLRIKKIKIERKDQVCRQQYVLIRFFVISLMSVAVFTHAWNALLLGSQYEHCEAYYLNTIESAFVTSTGDEVQNNSIVLTGDVMKLYELFEENETLPVLLEKKVNGIFLVMNNYSSNDEDQNDNSIHLIPMELPKLKTQYSVQWKMTHNICPGSACTTMEIKYGRNVNIFTVISFISAMYLVMHGYVYPIIPLIMMLMIDLVSLCMLLVEHGVDDINKHNYFEIPCHLCVEYDATKDVGQKLFHTIILIVMKTALVQSLIAYCIIATKYWAGVKESNKKTVVPVKSVQGIFPPPPPSYQEATTSVIQTV